MEKASKFGLTVLNMSCLQHMKGHGKMMNVMVMVRKFGLTKRNLMDHGRME